MLKTALLVFTSLLSALAPSNANLDCITPSCTTESDRATLWPFGDANFFLRCETGSPPASSWSLVRRPCTDRRLFHFHRQQCVLPSEWEEPCGSTELPQCPRITCRTPADQRILWPYVNPRFFERCVPGPTGGLVELLVECEGETRFSWGAQRCLPVNAWRPDCRFEDGEVSTTTVGTTITTAGPGERGECPVPVCRFQDETLYPHSDWTQFYQCVPDPLGRWFPLARPCALDTFFHFGYQRCVYMHEWEDFCVD